MTDAELLARFVRSKDQAAFAEIVHRHAGMVVAAARRLAPLDADDVAQATFFLLAQRATRLLGRATLAGWLYETARHCARNARRGRSRNERKLVAIQRDEPSTRAGDAVDLLDAALARLPSAMREVVLLRHVESLSVAETAERLGVAATTVTKRSERGLARLRDFFAARGHASLGVAGVATLLVAPASRVEAATLATAATGKATPAVAAIAATSSAVPLAIAAAATLAIAAVATGVAVRSGRPTPTIVAMTAPAAAAPASQPAAPTASLTQEGAKSVATAFLDAVRAGDRAAIDRFWEEPGENERAAKTAAILKQIEPYAAFPQRLALGGNGWFQMEPTVFNADGTTRPTSPGGPRLVAGTLEAQTPTEADIGRLVLKLNVVDGAWKVGPAEFVADGAVYAGTRVELAAATAAMPVPMDVARRALSAWEPMRPKREFDGVDWSKPTDAQVPRMIVLLKQQRDAVEQFASSLSGSPLALDAAEVGLVRSTIDAFVGELDRSPTAATAVRLMSDRARIEPATIVFGKVNATVEKLDAAMAAIEERTPSTTRVAVAESSIPLRIAWLNDEVVRLPGPVAFPEWLRSTRAWKQWEVQRDVKTFRTRDSAGNAYEVDVQGAGFGAGTDADGRPRPNVRFIRRYRPDGTLSAIANYQFGVGLSGWGEFDETGRRYVYRVETRAGYVEHPDTLRAVTFFAADGAMRRWRIENDGKNRVNWESVADPIGEHEETIHFFDANSKDVAKDGDDLPIEGLPIERE